MLTTDKQTNKQAKRQKQYVPDEVKRDMYNVQFQLYLIY